jgi:two-component system chemotaxis sensor kinase CheA
MTRDPALDTFIAESIELLNDMEAVLLRFEQGAADGESMNALFRAAHTIKGSSGLFGLNGIVSFTHVVEGVLDQVRARGTTVDPLLAAVLLNCADHLKGLVEAVAAGHLNEDAASTTAGQFVLERLQQVSGFAVKPTAAAGTPAPQDPAAPGTRRKRSRKKTGGRQVLADNWHVSVRFSADVLKNGMDPLAFLRYLTTFAEITGLGIVDDALPALEQFDPESCYVGFEISLKTDAPKSQIEGAFDFVKDDCELTILPPRSRVADFVALIRDSNEPEARIGELLVECGTLTEQELAACLKEQSERQADRGVAPRLGEILLDRAVVHPAVVEAAASQQAEARTSKDAKALDSRSIRVDGDKLDGLIDLIGELIIAGAATGSQARQAGLPRLTESAQNLARIVEEVRDQALKLRIVQIGPTFTRFQRVVRDVARESGKEITLEIGGSETELDKTLVERIADPLTHLVRNAIDHGIEKPELRVAAGKPAAGVVRLTAYHDAGSVVIEVADDGGGLKRERILKKALERGLISEGQVLRDPEIFALIFEPGFSTAEQVTNLSGRGVGMDVVKSNVTALRGSVEIDSQPGLGTQVRLRLPLTLAIIDGFQVGIGGSAFVIPLDLVEECVEFDAANGADQGRPFNLHGSVLPLVRLHALFGIPARNERRASVVVVRAGGKRVGILVDDLVGEIQAVIKPLSRLFRQLQGIAGSTILGNGKVALILDVPGLVARSQGASDRGVVAAVAALASPTVH